MHVFFLLMKSCLNSEIWPHALHDERPRYHFNPQFTYVSAIKLNVYCHTEYALKSYSSLFTAKHVLYRLMHF